MTDKLTFETPDSTGFVPDLSLKGKVYVHFKGGVYHLRGYHWDATNDLWVVNYFSLQGNVDFTRTAADFFGKTGDGLDRFRPIKSGELPNPWQGHKPPPPHYPPGVRSAPVDAVSRTEIRSDQPERASSVVMRNG